MKTVKWTLSIGFIGAKREGEFEVEDDAADDEIEEIAKDEVFQYVEWDFTVVAGE